MGIDPVSIVNSVKTVISFGKVFFSKKADLIINDGNVPSVYDFGIGGFNRVDGIDNDGSINQSSVDINVDTYDHGMISSEFQGRTFKISEMDHSSAFKCEILPVIQRSITAGDIEDVLNGLKSVDTITSADARLIAEERLPLEINTVEGDGYLGVRVFKRLLGPRMFSRFKSVGDSLVSCVSGVNDSSKISYKVGPLDINLTYNRVVPFIGCDSGEDGFCYRKLFNGDVPGGFQHDKYITKSMLTYWLTNFRLIRNQFDMQSKYDYQISIRPTNGNSQHHVLKRVDGPFTSWQVLNIIMRAFGARNINGNYLFIALVDDQLELCEVFGSANTHVIVDV